MHIVVIFNDFKWHLIERSDKKRKLLVRNFSTHKMDSDLKLNVFKICKSIVNPPNFSISSMPPQTSNYHPPTPPPILARYWSHILGTPFPKNASGALLLSKRLHILQKKQLQLMFFLNRNAHTGPLLKNFFKNLKFGDKSSIWELLVD